MTIPYVRIGRTVAQTTLKSTLWLITLLCWPWSLAAHEMSPSIVQITADGPSARVEMALAAESVLAGIDLSRVQDTDNAPEAQRATYEALRALPPDALEARIRGDVATFTDQISIAGLGPLALDAVRIDDPGDVELPRLTNLTFTAPIEADALRFSWSEAMGPVVVRFDQGDRIYAELIAGGAQSAPLTVPESAGAAFWRFTLAGVAHIIPMGLDHILFVLGLFFFALRWGPLLWQMTAFTVAHTVTLALATLGLITIPEGWMWAVEALIALSIVYVAVENILRPRLGWWRPAVVFGFGLLHGLGFASVLQDFGLSEGQFLVSLIAFNVGVEIGQLLVILGAVLVLLLALGAARLAPLDDDEALVRDREVMFRAASLTGSILIALVGAWWVVERTLL
ncbi:MAG: HupE/UreJ family protein [Shimia sp.]